ncbi:MAG: hypothetical protein K2O78_07380 [Muribaculaceae bacterium]|nr:hypothetical protein [Muribaculaceae bacterium]
MNGLLLVLVVGIIVGQFYFFKRSRSLIQVLSVALSGKFSTFYTKDNEDEIPVVDCESANGNQVTNSIISTINSYLKNNKGAVSDFNLIKDIVERNCDTLESEIESQTPLPLYLGLMGTVLGIIFGLGQIFFSPGGFENIGNVINSLMSDVAVAMFASFSGILFTTCTIWNAKKCKAIVEENKNRFYSWFQASLLPVISRSAVSEIGTLQRNLGRFNQSFSNTIDRLETKLEGVGDFYESQLEILEKIEKIDINRMASANVKILAALDGSMGSLERFATYMNDVTEYLTAVRELNEKLDDHLARTETLAVVSDFYKKQMQEISLRQDAIRSAVVGVDDVMRSVLADLQAKSEEGLRSMQETFVNQMNLVQQIVAQQTQSLTQQMNQVPQIVAKMNEISEIPAKLDRLVESIRKSNEETAKSVAKSVKALSTASVAHGGAVSIEPESGSGGINRWIPWALIAIAVFCLGNLIVNIVSLSNPNDQSAYETNSGNDMPMMLDDAVDSTVVDSVLPDSAVVLVEETTVQTVDDKAGADSRKNAMSTIN